MALRREDTTPKSNEFQIGGCSWIPTTPGKPDSTKQQLTCTNLQENQPAYYSSVNPVYISEGIDTRQAGQAAASSNVYRDTLSSFDTWQASKAASTRVYGEDLRINDEVPINDKDRWNNLSFGNLLALVHKGGNSTGAATENAGIQTRFVAKRSTHVAHFLPQTENTMSIGNSFVADHEAELISMPNIFRDGSSLPSRPFFNLKSPTIAIKDATTSKNLSPQFEPITPEKTSKTENRKECATKDSTTDGMLAKKDAQESTTTDQLCATTNTELHENHEPEKGGTEEADLSKTPQQKPRRKRHRPKVIKVGQTKSTPKPSPEKHSAPQETARVKRKYVRRKEINNTTNSPLEGETKEIDDSNKNASTSKVTPVGKGKYVRKKGIKEATLDKGTTETTDIKNVRHTRSSCRRSLNFNLEDQVRDESSSYSPSSNCEMESPPENFSAKDQPRTQGECRQGMENTCSTYQELKDRLLTPERHSPSPSAPTKTDSLQDEYRLTDQSVCTKGKCQIVFSEVTHDKEANTVNNDSLWPPKSPNDSNCSSSRLTTEIQNRGLKRNMGTTAESEICSTNATGTLYNSMKTYLSIFSQNGDKNECVPGMHFPTIYKKNRTEKGFYTETSSLQYTMTTSDSYMKLERHAPGDSSVAQYSATNLLMNNPAPDVTQNGRQVFEDLLALESREKIKRKRSKGPAQVQVSRGKAAKTSRTGHEILHELYRCKEALAADTCSTMTTKKGSKRSLLMKSTGQNCYNPHEFATKSTGLPLAITWECTHVIDSIINHFNQLDLNAENNQVSANMQNGFTSCHMHYQEQLALIPYQEGRALVPFDGSFDQVKRRQPRPKVDLDDETTRVWKLLLENINSAGVDGTDEEKAKWWEEERRVFTGRADSFIARMHLVQGDRRFSPWKGSVVDSVVGVFLTQNVSDHLSSSAFMSLAARFPLKSKTNLAELHEVSVGTKMKEPEVCVMDPDETIGLNKKVLLEPVSCEDDEIRVVNSVRSLGKSVINNVIKENLSGQLPDMFRRVPVMFESSPNKSMNLIGGGDTDDTVSSQTSVISSQNSADSAIAQTSERTESCSLSNSEEEPASGVKPNRFTSSTSFVKLLEMAGTVLHGVYGEHSDKKESGDNQQVQSENLALSSPAVYGLDDLTFPSKPNTSWSKSVCLAPNSGARAECLDSCKKNTMFSVTSSKKGLCATEISELSVECESQTTFQKFTSSEEDLKCSRPNAPSSHNDKTEINLKVLENQRGQVLDQENSYKMHDIQDTCPQNLMDVSGNSSNFDYSRKSEHKELNSNKNDPGKAVGPKAKEGRIEKEKQTADWDGLRKKAQEGGKKREKTANTMDSVDWAAVRNAEVHEIAQTIKDRGMNNKLAERIQDFLNRIVRDHGSIDLEWLRDVPPDEAKEYLLSIRGLGLKSVECVRLLTLHHLAFPVDTNVGRIAVRLGWVPLQPLPESLQLHLLELYPVLESIQKYLWPRLCKLDQRTLYELHYQMITFGKVFCTKSKPNCNACPMRGECRHFASAFASARLALPATEEKSIVGAAENKAASQNPMRRVNTLQLPSPQSNPMDVQSGVSNSQPIIEEPGTPEPIIEVPDTPEPEYTQVPECDIEDKFYEDPDEIPTIQLNMEQFTQNLKKVVQQNTELQECFMSKALVALTPEAASIPVPKLKNISRLRTEHQVYELPDSHPLLEGMDKREEDDPCPYLLAIWTPGETVNSIEPAETRCSSHEADKLCTDETCLSCNSIRELNSQTVRGTLLIPCRTAMRGSFPLNGTYFQVNEVFSDHESSLTPVDVPREWLWNLSRRTVYFGTSIPTIFKGLTTEGIQYCFWRGFVCVRGFDRTTRAPRPLIARLHFPASKLAKGKGKTDNS
ncbi:hypothetical protein RD792_012033 [Penstemon davidsonii]|uniref:HhH-GPD domain-containing protein n=1 Tax=Penstemon davidsonii TaxID=160366 RepID=A0ABR0CX59_9LAMI|nr:hypothetical protein RD792_012033 [Penstemon davidsonii]